MRKQSIVHVTASPRGSVPLQFGEENAVIERELRMAARRESFEFLSRSAVSIDDFVRCLTEVNPDIIHVSAHGHGGESLLLQNELGEPQPVSPQGLRLMVAAGAPGARVAVLAFCNSTAHAKALRRNVDCVIAMDGPIADTAAIAFARPFYSALANCRSVGNAFALGVAALTAKRLPDAAFPRCVTRDGVDAHRVVLAPRHTGVEVPL